MATQSELVQGLEQASQKNEKELVIEFAPDRILHYFGAYLVGFLAVVAKIAELAGTNLSCYPSGNISVPNNFITYATSYCWETSSPEKNNSTPNDGSAACHSDKKLLKNPYMFKTIIQWMPYVMILEALLFALPSVWWHYRVGARLMGHIKFMKLLLNKIYDKVEKIPNAVYQDEGVYDRESRYLDGWNRFRPKYEWNAEPSSEPQSRSCFSALRLRFRRNKNDEPVASVEEVTNLTDQRPMHTASLQNSAQRPWYTRLFFGEMCDRYLFSMFCFDNFSSLEHHPYIISMYRLSQAKENFREDEATLLSQTSGILRLVCNENNFRGLFLVKCYFIKHAMGVTIALIALAATIVILSHLESDSWHTESFRCEMLYHADVCMICTIRRKRDTEAYLLVNLLVNVMYLTLSLAQWIFIRRSPMRATSYYFEDISDFGSVALCN